MTASLATVLFIPAGRNRACGTTQPDRPGPLFEAKPSHTWEKTMPAPGHAPGPVLPAGHDDALSTASAILRSLVPLAGVVVHVDVQGPAIARAWTFSSFLDQLRVVEKSRRASAERRSEIREGPDDTRGRCSARLNRSFRERTQPAPQPLRQLRHCFPRCRCGDPGARSSIGRPSRRTPRRRSAWTGREPECPLHTPIKSSVTTPVSMWQTASDRPSSIFRAIWTPIRVVRPRDQVEGPSDPRARRREPQPTTSRSSPAHPLVLDR